MLSQSNGNGTAPRILPASEMSASQRNQTFDATIQQLNLVITQVNTLTRAQGNLDASVSALIPLLQVDGGFRGIEPLYAFQSRSFWQRLRWLVTGR